MLKRMLLVTALTLGGCTTTQFADFLKQVQADAAGVCHFVPTIDTILSVAASLGVPVVGGVQSGFDIVARFICSQVPPPASAQFKALAPFNGGPARTAAVVNGIPINGWRTQ